MVDEAEKTESIIEANIKTSSEEITFPNEMPPSPNYEEWLNKPCWYKDEISYLAQGIEPDKPVLICSVPENESEETKCVRVPINIGIEQTAYQLENLIERAKEAGELKSTAGGNGFKPRDTIAYLRNAHLPKGVILPAELLQHIEQKEKNEASQNLQEKMEIMARDLISQGRSSQATKGKLAQKLAQETDRNPATIERRTRKTW